MHKMRRMMSPADPSLPDLTRGFCLGEWQVRPMAGLLERNGHKVHVEPKVMDVLVCLARHSGDVVTRDMLLAEVWGDVVVSDDAITRCVSELRTVLGDTGRERSFIRTTPRRGYSLIVPISWNGNGNGYAYAGGNIAADHAPIPLRPVNGETVAAAAEPELPPPSRPRLNGLMRSTLFVGATAALIIGAGMLSRDSGEIDAEAVPAAPVPAEAQSVRVERRAPQPEPVASDTIASVAVLPFVNLSGSPENEYFSDGLSEDIRDALQRHTDLRVAARTSSSVFKNTPMDIREIAAQLNVDALLEGTVRVSDGRLRVTTALTHAGTGYSIWSSSFERDAADKVQLQTEVATEIVNQLAPSLGMQPGGIRAPTANVQAHDYYLLGRHHWHLRTAESLEKAVQYFREALALDPDYALAHSGLADALLFQVPYGGKQFAEVEVPAREAVQRALELDPDLAEAHASQGILMDQTGHPDEALAAYQRAVDLKPQYSMAQMWLGNSWMEGGRDMSRAFFHYSEALEVDPLHPQVQSNYGNALMNLGRYDEAIGVMERFSKIDPNDKVLRMLLYAHLTVGRFDEVLNLAVGHTFTGEYKPYASEIVIETLIQLQRFDEARRMINDNAASMEPWWEAWLRASLAVVSRDAEGLEQAAELWNRPEMLSDHPAKAGCAKIMNRYLLGLSAYLGRDYELSNARFVELEHDDMRKICYSIEPEVEVASLMYHGAARLKLDPQDARARELLAAARDRIEAMRRGGWDSMNLNVIAAALNFMSGDAPAGWSQVQAMVERGWQPYGVMRSSPLFDAVLDEQPLPERWARLAREFEAMQARCGAISLAKLGL
jgi:TolB-like protein/DNA-binding winged helix-turn-helix (wHTH) protein/cytochrome c-type biogenesis protein CcmH/NrfG